MQAPNSSGSQNIDDAQHNQSPATATNESITTKHEENIIMEQFVANINRRNALTPETHNIEPIKQTEMQERMSNLTVSGDQDKSGESSSRSTV